MKKIYFILSILSLLSFLVKSIEESTENNPVSELIEMVRMEIIDKSLLSLPKRTEVNILKMSNQMNKLKEEYSFNEAESAYLVFKWIAQSVEVNFYNEDSDDLTNAYNSGKGTPKQLSSLFNNFCSFLNVTSDSISGYLKWVNTKNIELISNRDYTWNYVEINGKYYLIDVSLASDMKFSRYDYLYFGTKPEIFICLHFPKDDKWQLLSEAYTFEKFESMAALNPSFYFFGFENIYPNSNKIFESGKIVLNSDRLIARKDILYSCITKKNTDIGFMGKDDYEGTLKNEIEYNVNGYGCLIFYLEAKEENSNIFEKIAFFSINQSKNYFLGFKKIPNLN